MASSFFQLRFRCGTFSCDFTSMYVYIYMRTYKAHAHTHSHTHILTHTCCLYMKLAFYFHEPINHKQDDPLLSDIITKVARKIALSRKANIKHSGRQTSIVKQKQTKALMLYQARIPYLTICSTCLLARYGVNFPCQLPIINPNWLRGGLLPVLSICSLYFATFGVAVARECLSALVLLLGFIMLH